MRHRILILFAVSLFTVAAVAQETLYITDNLQLGLYRTQDGSGDPIRNLVSGAAVSVLERIPNFARVRTADGEEGWVKSAFLVAEKPARLRVAEVEAERQQMADELEQALLARDAAAADAEGMVADAASALASAEAERGLLAQLERDNAALSSLVDGYRGALPWKWVVGALLLALAGGFVAGYWWLDASIRRRYGGFRVH